ncbi:MAG: FHA domain-containing protein [Acidobacteriota bacterium]|nr:FHA domain-containing protein [Acidobacteriota bacterium]
MARLIISAPDGKRGILEITKPVITVGRGNANDLVFNHASVSRFHAVIKLEPDGRVLVADRDSTNGVLVNGARITAETPLENGADVQIGAYGLKYESTAEGALRVEKVEVPSTVNEVLNAEALQSPASAETPVGSKDDLIAQVKKLEREKYLLTVLYDAGKSLSAKLSIDAIAKQVAQLAFRIEGVERGFMMLFDEDGDVQRQTEVRYRQQPKTQQPQISLSRSVLDLIKTEKQPILISDASADERFTGSESMKISGLQSAMCAPLLGKERLLGIFYVDNLEQTAAFTQDELNVFALVAAQAAAAIDSAITHELLARQAVQRSALERFLSPDVVEMIAADPDNVRLGGANQVVTVLFADIRGFTSISEKLPPEKVVEILNEYFTRLTDVIFDNGGMLDKYLGDGAMAVFGAPITKGNDALNAVRAGIEIQRLVLQLNVDSAVRKWPELRVGIGINTGIVTAGNIGSPRRLDYTVVGDTVNVAARLMANAAGWQVLISESTAQTLGPEFQIEPLAPLSVKGKSEPLSVFSVPWGESKKRATSGR